MAVPDPSATSSVFDVLFSPLGDNKYRAQVMQSEVGRPSTDFTLPFTFSDLAAFYPPASRGLIHVDDVAAAAPTLTVQDFGAGLFNAVFAGAVGEALQRSLDAARGKGRSLCVRLDMSQTPDLAQLPWEYLYATPLARPLALSTDTPLVRYLDVPEPDDYTPAPPPLKVLGVVSNPNDVLPRLDVEGEWTRLHDALDPLQSAGLVRLTRLPQTTMTSLADYLGREDVHVLHFIGHGDYNATMRQGGLVFEGDNGRHVLVSADQLAPLLHDHKPLRLVFLNACQGAEGAADDAFGGLAQVLVRQEAPMVLAMQFAISDSAAKTLARSFYQGLADGKTVDIAVTEARKDLNAAGNNREWGTPILFSRVAGMQLIAPRTGDAKPIIPHQLFEPETVLIPQGKFRMGSMPGDNIPPEETPQFEMSLPDFRIGTYPVTNSQYAAFLRETPDLPQPDGWFLKNPPKGKEDYPVTFVSWSDATQYCEWLSKKTNRRYRLPTEAEWEKAARGTDGRRYPWGDAWADNRCNVASAGPTAVTAYPDGASPYGVLDMLGNVEEWTSTVWGGAPKDNAFPYPYKPDDGREDTEAAQFLVRSFHVCRGGSFRDTPDAVRAPVRRNSHAGNKVGHRGFRVAMTLQ